MLRYCLSYLGRKAAWFLGMRLLRSYFRGEMRSYILILPNWRCSETYFAETAIDGSGDTSYNRIRKCNLAVLIEEKCEVKMEKAICEYYLNIDPKPVDWLWYPYIPLGKLTVIQGNPGVASRTVEKVKKELNVVTYRSGGCWYWKLPEAHHGI